jgi:arylsulfatase A
MLAWALFPEVGIARQGQPTVDAQNPPPSRPNIVFILADDLGYGELGCYGQEKIQTPNLDRLARGGMKLTQHYAGAPVCAPSRCVLLTGKQLHRAKIRGNRDSGKGGPFPGQWPLSEESQTIPEILKQAGYTTGGFGKWGLGPTDSGGSPMKQGFDRFFGYNCQRNAHSYFPAFLDDNEHTLRLNSRPIAAHQKPQEPDVSAERYRSDVYAPDRILVEAIEFIDHHRDRPFFLYLPFIEPHVAMHPPAEWVDRYPLKWDEATGPYRGENGYLPHPRPRAAYAAMISHLDDHVGKIIEALEHRGLMENTLIVFTSDNGPTHGGSDPRFSIGGAGCEFFGSTGGLKGYKGSCYEGGLRVPCILHWPSVIQAGTVSPFLCGFADWLITLSQVAHAPAIPDTDHDGISLLPLMLGKELPPRKPALIWDFTEYGGIVAIRQGNLKAIRRGLQTSQPAAWELYNIAEDPHEAHNLAAGNGESIGRLEAEFMQTRCVEPDFPNPVYD